jgi:hypothetical protein
MHSTRIVVSSVRPSVCLSPISQPLLNLEAWNFQHKSVALQWSIVRSGIWGPWPRSPEIWPWPGPLPEKNTFTSITRVPVVPIEQIRAHLEDLSARIILSSESIVTCASGLIRPKSHISNIRHVGTLSIRNFIMLVHAKNHVADFTSTKTYSLRSKNMSLILRQPKRTPHVVRNRSNP